jgi:AraC-like DNA-binding protein
VPLCADVNRNSAFFSHRLERLALPLRQSGMDARTTISIGSDSNAAPEPLHRLQAMRRAAILGEIEQRSGEPDLSAVAVADRLGITPRYVHMLLKETGRTFRRHVMDRRLQNAAALLRDPQWHHRRIGDVATAAGFCDLAHFSRAFRRKYAATPSDIRQAARRAG